MVFVVLMSRIGDFECVNAGSGVIMFHHQPWVAEIGNEANTFVKLNNLKHKKEIRTSVRIEKLADKRGLHRFLPLTATTIFGLVSIMGETATGMCLLETRSSGRSILRGSISALR